MALCPLNVIALRWAELGLLRTTEMGDRWHAGPDAWNRLPEAVRQAQTQPHFKKLFKKHFIFI